MRVTAADSTTSTACAETRDDDARREQQRSSERGRVDDRGRAQPDSSQVVDYAFTRPVPVDSLAGIFGEAEVLKVRVALHPHYDGTTLYAGIEIVEGQALQEALDRLRATLLTNLERDAIEAADESDKGAVERLRDRVRRGELPVAAVSVRSTNRHHQALANRSDVYAVGTDGREALLPLDPASVAARGQICNEVGR